jgi:hypothetical protein
MDNRLGLRGRFAHCLTALPMGGCGPLCLSESVGTTRPRANPCPAPIRNVIFTRPIHHATWPAPCIAILVVALPGKSGTCRPIRQSRAIERTRSLRVCSGSRTTPPHASSRTPTTSVIPTQEESRPAQPGSRAVVVTVRPLRESFLGTAGVLSQVRTYHKPKTRATTGRPNKPSSPKRHCHHAFAGSWDIRATPNVAHFSSLIAFV